MDNFKKWWADFKDDLIQWWPSLMAIIFVVFGICFVIYKLKIQ